MKELFDCIQSDFVTLDCIKPLPGATRSFNMGASPDTDDPSDTDHEDILDTLVNLGVSEDTLECVQSDLDVQAARQVTRPHQGKSWQ